MIGQRRREGYLLIDNRNSPGVTADFVRATGKDAPVVGEGEVFESAVSTCSHCQTQVILNPNRSRPRNYCRGCDSFICDECALIAHLTGKCVPFRKVMDHADHVLPTLTRRAQQPDGDVNLTLELLRRSVSDG